MARSRRRRAASTASAYAFRPDSPISRFGFSAEIAGRTIERIARENGGAARPEQLVDVARPRDHPLHGYFEWRNDVAAEAHRRSQACNLIRAVIVRQPTAAAPTYVRAFVNLAPGRGYEMIATVLSDEDKRNQLLARALAELEQMQARYAHLVELADIWVAASRARRRAA